MCSGAAAVRSMSCIRLVVMLLHQLPGCYSGSCVLFQISAQALPCTALACLSSIESWQKGVSLEGWLRSGKSISVRGVTDAVA